jgi:chemotaxis protein CheX
MTGSQSMASLAAVASEIEWLARIENAAREVFELMVGTGLTRLPAEPDRELPEHTAMVGLAGTLCGVMTVRCSSRTAAVIASKMLGIPPDQAANESRDALGEICNMVAGAFKNQVPSLQQDCLLSVPTVISGADYELQSLGNGERIRCDFLMDQDRISVVLETRPRKPRSVPANHSVV